MFEKKTINKKICIFAEVKEILYFRFKNFYSKTSRILKFVFQKVK